MLYIGERVAEVFRQLRRLQLPVRMLVRSFSHGMAVSRPAQRRYGGDAWRRGNHERAGACVRVLTSRFCKGAQGQR